jgi:anaerobic magnesium-protoporphyrin IX monomethyl ester cyclase
MIENSDFRVLIAYPNLSMMLTPSYAVGLFTSVLKEQGYGVELFDCTSYKASQEFMDEPLPVTRANKMLNSRKFDAESLYGSPKTGLIDDFAAKLAEYQPHAVIFSTLVEDTWPQAEEMLQALAKFSDIKSIIGGVYTTMAAADVIASTCVQCVGNGEGEEVIVEFCERVRKGESLQDIAGTWARDEQGDIQRNAPRPLVNINNVIPDFSLFDERRFLRPLGAKIWKAIPLETYRGCPYTCTFCNSPTQVVIAKENKQGHYLRRKSMANLKVEMEVMIERHNPEFFYINDDAFMARPKQEISEFAEMYSDIKIPFWFQTRFEDISKDKLEQLKEVGCYRISFGLEHGNQQYRQDKLRRKMTNEFVVSQAQIVAEVGIPYTLNIIIGFPYETRDLVFDSIKLCRDIHSFDSLSVNVFVPYHGTPLREMALKEGWLNPERQTTSVIAESILEMPPPYLSGPEILTLQRVFPLYVRMPESRYPEIKRAEVADEEGEAMLDELSAEFYEMTYGRDEADRMLTYSG